jgi:hypothetical protein
MPWTLPPQPALATDRFILILATLWKWVWEKPGPAMTGPLSLAIRKRIWSMRERLAVLAKRFHDGTLQPPKPRGPRSAPAPAEDAAPRTRNAILPRGFGWLCGLVPSWAAGAGSQMQHQLNDPEMRALEAASPEAARLIRSLLWMTGQRHPDYRYVPSRKSSRRERAERPPQPGQPRTDPMVPAEIPQPVPPPQAPEALLVTPVIEVERWSHLSLMPGRQRRDR